MDRKLGDLSSTPRVMVSLSQREAQPPPRGAVEIVLILITKAAEFAAALMAKGTVQMAVRMPMHTRMRLLLL
jgi:hypothetical protein